MSKEVKAWKCEKCNKYYLVKSFADSCCEVIPEKVNKCETCGGEVEKNYLKCGSCRGKEQFERAKKVKYSDYDIGCLWDESKQKYFGSKEELEEQYEDDAQDLMGYEAVPEFPIWCYGCISNTFSIDIDFAIERAEENMYEDFEADRDGFDLKGLREFVKNFNEMQTAKSYDTDYKTVVLLNE